MRVVLAGGSGFVGQKITELLLKEGHEVVILSRKEKPAEPGVQYVTWLTEGSAPEESIGSADAFINLAGVSINDGRWTKEHQKQIYDSRMIATDELLRIISKMPEKPSVFLNASAVGIYPTSKTVIYTENSQEVDEGILGRTVRDWEQKASSLKDFGIRTAYMRFGLVLGKNEGALPLMVLPYKFFVGGKVGSGRQWVSWVHVKDVARAAIHLLNTEQSEGPFNITAPFPVRMNEFGKTIASTLHRPNLFPAPAFLMKTALGEKSTLVLEGQFVTSEKLIASGFEFEFPTLASALDDLLN
ncbi:TIGR01777 family oxidoreductase [Sporosarcina oncorhynchi]|uniref:TIGR01777 family oxidoreductase n=1 Tax=Sporosarcina oncorhynchi TaxID=3056444 RepID=A0ABZ0L4X7_9BACL|nr:TIGR01777 family oxidoreductase [Sporosarcina sp. T2O-4]WOV86621.1 TIGR01777 family oxidoreductase [Sporosarcina sp. T2O-4]